MPKKGECRTPKPTVEKQATPADSPPPQDLRGWVRHLEIEFLKQASFPGTKVPQWALSTLHSMRKGAKDFETRCWSLPNRQEIERIAGDLPKEITFQEALSERLLIVWADEVLWRLIRTGQQHPPPPPHTIDDYVRGFLVSKYHLQLPFPPCVWLEMVRQPRERAFLFQLMVLTAPRFFWVQSPDPEKDLDRKWRAALSRDMLGDLLKKYVHNPGQDWRPALCVQVAREDYPNEVLEWLRLAVNRLADDIAYIIQHPDRFDARRAPPVAHRIRNLREAKVIEGMVDLLRRDAGLSDNALAEEFMSGAAAAGRKLANQFKGKITAADRRLAKEARRLGFYREGLPVKLHKSFGDKNAPRTSA
jgi:hypothetical protein